MPIATPIEVQRLTCARIPTDFGVFELCLYANDRDDKEHLALVMGDVLGRKRYWSVYIPNASPGMCLGSRRCDCGDQLRQAMQRISAAEKGVIIYLRQEGRGIGLLNKLQPTICRMMVTIRWMQIYYSDNRRMSGITALPQASCRTWRLSPFI